MASNTQYLKPFTQPTWNKTEFTSEGLLVLKTNTTDKDRGFKNKADAFIFNAKWVLSPTAGVLIYGTNSPDGMFDIANLTKTDDKWDKDEEANKAALQRLGANQAVYLQVNDLPVLHALSQCLAESRLIVDTGKSWMINLDYSPNLEEFKKEFNLITEWLLEDEDRIFLNYPDPLKELARCDIGFNLIYHSEFRKNAYTWVKGKAPRFDSLELAKVEIAQSKTTRKASPKERVENLLSLIGDKELIDKVTTSLKEMGLQHDISTVFDVLAVASLNTRFRLMTDLMTTPNIPVEKEPEKQLTLEWKNIESKPTNWQALFKSVLDLATEGLSDTGNSRRDALLEQYEFNPNSAHNLSMKALEGLKGELQEVIALG